MYPFLPIGPLSLPTAPLFALLGAWLGLSVAARTGARLSADPDRVLTAGILAIGAGLIVARLWHVVQFWPIYQQNPLQTLSPRPGGLAFWPGLAGAVIGYYAYLLRKRMDPSKVTAALSAGVLFAMAMIQIGGFLSGSVVGTPGDLPWTVDHFGVMRHPVGLYRAVGLLAAVGWLYWRSRYRGGWSITLQALFAYGLVHLLADAFLADASTVAGLRRSQTIGLAVALLAALLLASRTTSVQNASHKAAPSAEVSNAERDDGQRGVESPVTR